MSKYFIRVQHLDGNWYKPGRLETFHSHVDTPAGYPKGWQEPSFETLAECEAAIAKHYGDCTPGSVRAIRLPVPKKR